MNKLFDFFKMMFDFLFAGGQTQLDVVEVKPMKKTIAISSGHGKLVRGASNKTTGMDEVDQARRVVDKVAALLKGKVKWVSTFHDNTSTNKDNRFENTNTQNIWHTAHGADINVQVHFNSSPQALVRTPIGTEVFYAADDAADLAKEMSDKIAFAGGFLNRGAKKTDIFGFLNRQTNSILIEVCFVNSSVDAELYFENFDDICQAIASTLAA